MDQPVFKLVFLPAIVAGASNTTLDQKRK